MAQPTPYNPTNDFSQDEVNSVAGRSTVKTAGLDSELAAISTTIGQILANLKILQRDDTKLANALVHANAFDAGALALMASKSWDVKGAWATSTAYVVGDLVENGGYSYICAVAHTSGTFSTDQAAGYWVALTTVNSDDLASSANGKGASLIAIEDAGSNFTGTDVEAALAELATDVATRLLASAVSAFGATLIDDADSAEALTTLGVSGFIQTLLDDADAPTARNTLGLFDAYNLANQFAVSAVSGALQVTVQGGFVHPRGVNTPVSPTTVVKGVPTSATLNIDSETLLNGTRYDLVCVNIQTPSSPTLEVVKGTPSTGGASDPTLQPYQIPLARVQVLYGQTSISDVNDLRQPLRPHNFRGCLLNLSASTDINAGIYVAWDNEAYDTDAFHDNTTNPSRITIPAGVRYVRLRASINVFPPAGVAHTVQMHIYKNGAAWAEPGMAKADHAFDSGDTIYLSLETPVLAVSAGDYFELYVDTNTSTTATMLGGNSATWLSLEVVE